MEEYSIILYSFLSLILLLLGYKLLLQPKTSGKNLPPSPPSLPVIGHLHLLKRPMHRFYHSLSQKYGPIYSLRLGSRLAVIVSSSTVAEECLTKNNDVVLANRPKLLIGKHIGYDWNIVVSADYGDHWRNLRRIFAVEIFSSSRLNGFLSIRQDEVKRLLIKLWNNEDGFSKVEPKWLFLDLNFNNIMRMVAGKRYYGGDKDNETDEAEGKKFRGLMEEVAGAGGVHPADFIPILKWIGGGKSYVKKLINIGERFDGFLQMLIDESRGKKKGNTMIDHLLSLQETKPEYYTDQNIKGIVQVMLVAGVDTVVVGLEWAMCHLLNNPHVLEKARAEIDTQIGQDKLMEEADISKLPYLQGIVLETLRLNPPAPVLIPHMSSTDCTICGYDVPRDTIIMINAWAIHRDPKVWDDPMSFKPERFANKNNGDQLSESSSSSKLMPFGMGRRACPGATLANKIMGLTLGSMIQCFDWERVDGKEIDMTDSDGTTMPKVVPLEALCKPRPIPIVNKLLNGAI